MGELQDQIRLGGLKPALLEEITALSRQYAIVTPYTQALVDDRVSLDAGSQARALSSNSLRANGFVQGSFATSQSVNNRGLVQNGQVYDNAFFGEDGGLVRIGGARAVSGRALFYRDGFWTEGDWPASAVPQRIRRFSGEYWELLRRHPELSEAIASGPKVRLLIGGQPVEIGDAGSPAAARPAARPARQRSSAPPALVGGVLLLGLWAVARRRAFR